MAQKEPIQDEEVVVQLVSQNDLVGPRQSIRVVEHEFAVILDNGAVSSGPFSEETRPTLTIKQTILSAILCYGLADKIYV